MVKNFLCIAVSFGEILGMHILIRILLILLYKLMNIVKLTLLKQGAFNNRVLDLIGSVFVKLQVLIYVVGFFLNGLNVIMYLFYLMIKVII